MNLLTGLKAIVFFVFVAAAAATLHVGGQEVAAQNKAPAKAQAQNGRQTPPPAASNVTYSYKAQPGDSYSLMARKAVQTYGKKFNVNLSQAGIIFAETNLTQAAGSPSLTVGQNVSIAEATVKQWVDRAKNLSQAEQAAWNYYVQFADFNTNRVGQS